MIDFDSSRSSHRSGFAGQRLRCLVTLLVTASLGVSAACTPDNEPARTSTTKSSAAQQLPFSGLKFPVLAADSSGTVYALDAENRLVVSVAQGASRQVALPFGDLDTLPVLERIVVDGAGSVYVAAGDRVYKLPRGAASPTVMDLGFTSGEQNLSLADFAIDSQGNLFAVTGEPVVGGVNPNRVVAIPAGSATPTVLPFRDAGFPRRIGVDSMGNVYVEDGLNSRILKLTKGSDHDDQLPMTGRLTGMKVDEAGNVYAWDKALNRVVELSAGATEQEVLPFTGMDTISEEITVDSTGAVYIPDSGNGRVLKWSKDAPSATALAFGKPEMTVEFAPQRLAVDTSENVYASTGFNGIVLKLEQRR